MNGQVVRLGPGECNSVETGARFFGALAFPGEHEVVARQNAIAAWVSSYLHEANRVDKTDAAFADPRFNAFVRHPPKWCGQKLRTVNRRLRDRYALARTMRPWVREALGQPQALPPGIDKFTQEKISLWLFNNYEDAANNFRKRAWRPGLPVAHIVIASDLILSSAGKDEMEFRVDLANIRPIETIVSLARHMEAVVCSAPRFKVTSADLLHLEWIG